MNGRKLAFYFVALTIVFAIGGFTGSSYILASTKDASKFALSKKDDGLYEEIKTYRETHKIEPIDATVDRVWKAIPGYNGLDVDIEKSYKKMKKSGKFDTNKIIFKETSPSVHLDDLAVEPIYRGNPQKPMVALLINVAWNLVP